MTSTGGALMDLPVEDSARPVMKAIRTRFLTNRSVARHMVDQHKRSCRSRGSQALTRAPEEQR
jgi:hypothetical protein